MVDVFFQFYYYRSEELPWMFFSLSKIAINSDLLIAFVEDIIGSWYRNTFDLKRQGMQIDLVIVSEIDRLQFRYAVEVHFSTCVSFLHV